DKNPFDADQVTELRRCAAQLRQAPRLALRLLVEFAPKCLGEKLTKGHRVPPGHAFFPACEEIAAAVTDATAHLRAALLRDLDAALARDKQRRHVMSFDDLLRRTHEALHDPERRPVLRAAIRARYTVALIDEFQGTDALQYSIFAECFAGRPMFLVGDPKQSIFGFRGADLSTYGAARRDAVAVETLDTNHRSSVPLVQAVGQLFAPPNAFVEPGITIVPVRPRARAGALGLDGDPGAALRWRVVSGGPDDGPLVPLGRED